MTYDPFLVSVVFVCCRVLGGALSNLLFRVLYLGHVMTPEQVPLTGQGCGIRPRRDKS